MQRRLAVAVTGLITVPIACSGAETPAAPTAPMTSASTAADGAAGVLADAAGQTADEPRVRMRLTGSVETRGSAPHTAAGTFHTDVERRRGTIDGVDNGVRTRLLTDGDRFSVTSEAASFVAAMPPGARWVTGTFDDVSDRTVVRPPAGPIFPLYVFGATDVRRNGDRFVFTLDVDRVVERAPDEWAHRLRELLRAEPGRTTAEGEATIDPSGRLTELTVDALVVDSEAAAAPTRAHWEASFSDFGESVELNLPADSEVVTLAEVPELESTFLRGR